LQGSDPNGTWSLYIHDDEPGDSGSAPGGWTLTLELQAAPLQITRQPTDQTVKIGGTAKFDVTAIGTGPLSYRWKKNQIELTDSQRISGVSMSQLTITNVQSKDAGTYSVVVSNASETVSSQVANLQSRRRKWCSLVHLTS
jgi:subtilisin-like proprotein convertase family protein